MKALQYLLNQLKDCDLNQMITIGRLKQMLQEAMDEIEKDQEQADEVKYRMKNYLK